MPVYTVSPDLLRNIEKDEGIYFTDILFVFCQRGNPYKISRDKQGEIIEIYKSITENGDIIKVWLDFMSFKPSPFDVVDVDISEINCEEAKFLKVCKETASQNKLIVYSNQNIKKYKCERQIVMFENTAIEILERDIAKKELSVISEKGDTIINSQVAKGFSQISDSQNLK